MEKIKNNRKNLILTILSFILIFIFFFNISLAQTYEYYYPVKNQNFTSDSSGWVYGEENDVNAMASGAWSSTGGRNNPGSYKFSVEDASATAMANVEQYINYSFTVNNINDLQSAKLYASFNLTCDNDFVVYAYINLILPDGSVQRIWTSQTYTGANGLDTGWINVNSDVTSNFTQTGNYQLSLGVHTETSDSGANADKTNCYHYLDDAGVELAYPLEFPKWGNQSQSNSQPGVGAKVNLSAYWQDNVALSHAWLATNETGEWENKTGVYLIDFNSATSSWSNFTWQNSSIPAYTTVCWRIYANDTNGNTNATDIMCFTTQPNIIAWSKQAQSTSVPGVGAEVSLSAYWYTNGLSLQNAWLATNETGEWRNYTDLYLKNFYTLVTNQTFGENSTQIAIPDDDGEVYSYINITENKTITGVKVCVDITHTYISDLIVTLYHPDGSSVTLWSREGGSADNIHKCWEITHFNLRFSKGLWKLGVSDNAAYDTGTIDHWNLTISYPEKKYITTQMEQLYMAKFFYPSLHNCLLENLRKRYKWEYKCYRYYVLQCQTNLSFNGYLIS